MPSKSQKSFSRNVKLTLEYDGSSFFGFQRQTDRPTIQSELEKALSRLFNRPMKIVAAAGRTDSGVHAQAQVVNFKTGSKLPLEKIQKGLNALLPDEIAVRQIEEVPASFHARYSVKTKTYEYRILNSYIRSPLLNGQVYQYVYPLNLSLMKKAARLLLGRKNFSAFQAAGSPTKSSIRSVKQISMRRRGDEIKFLIEADGFLYHMVRNIAGTLLEVGRGKISLKDFQQILKRKNRARAGPAVPALGLTLISVKYPF